MRDKEGGVVSLQRPPQRLSSNATSRGPSTYSHRDAYVRPNSACSSPSTYGQPRDKYGRPASACSHSYPISSSRHTNSLASSSSLAGTMSKQSESVIHNVRPLSEKKVTKSDQTIPSKYSNSCSNHKLTNITTMKKENYNVKVEIKDTASSESSKLLNVAAKSAASDNEIQKKKIPEKNFPVKEEKTSIDELPMTPPPSPVEKTENTKSPAGQISSSLSVLNISSEVDISLNMKLNIPLPSGEEHYYSNDSEDEDKLGQHLQNLEIQDKESDGEKDEDDEDGLVAKCPGKKDKTKQRVEPYPAEYLILHRGHQSGGGLINNQTQVSHSLDDFQVPHNLEPNLQQEIIQFYESRTTEEVIRLNQVIDLLIPPSGSTPPEEQMNSPAAKVTEEEQSQRVKSNSPALLDSSRSSQLSTKNYIDEPQGSISPDSGVYSPSPGSISPASAPMSPWLSSPKSCVGKESHNNPPHMVQPDAKILHEDGLDVPAEKRLESKVDKDLLLKYWKDFCFMEEADLKQFNENGDTKLMIAVKESNLEKINILVERIVRKGEGDLLLHVNTERQSALTLAALKDPLAARLIVDAIVKLGKQPDQLLDGGKHHLVHTLVRYGDERGEVLAELLNARGRTGERVFAVDDKDSNDKTPLLVAAETHSSRRSTVAVTKLLIKHGANIWSTDKDKRNALHLAIKHSCDTVLIKALLQNIPSQMMHVIVNAQDVENRTPLHLAAMVKDLLHSKHLEVIELLKKFGAKNNFFDCLGKLPMSYFNSDRSA